MNQILDPHLFASSLLLEHPHPNSSSTSVCILDLACNLLRLKSFPSKWYLIGIPLSPPWKASVSMAENIMLNSVEARTQPCLNPFVTGNGSENAVILTLASILSWNCLTIAMNLAGQPNFAIILQSPSWLTVSNALIMFLAFLLKLSCCEDHFSCSSVLPESTFLVDYHQGISLLSVAGKILASPMEPNEWTLWTVRASTRKPSL